MNKHKNLNIMKISKINKKIKKKNNQILELKLFLKKEKALKNLKQKQ